MMPPPDDGNIFDNDDGNFGPPFNEQETTEGLPYGDVTQFDPPPNAPLRLTVGDETNVQIVSSDAVPSDPGGVDFGIGAVDPAGAGTGDRTSVSPAVGPVSWRRRRLPSGRHEVWRVVLELSAARRA
jgi:hypothetical protein